MNDKLAHFLVGAGISAIVGVILGPLFGLAAAVVAGAAKELWDRAGHGTPDIWDFVATAAGGMVVVPFLL